ncbi:hypothetical protein NQ015_09925 [Corynebacterium sp. 153RC1]|uniref:hypothetical protein n=1 Tax=unclassified Corynebacterium TaxID=2624378 RepID=UPI00211C1C5E|nr:MULTISPECIES: hypothetical protein [unclassified Corynebacterium]MCQ9366329.1 hypothetical protein [Corynebacterium sp. 70RC1]MCQ9371371.1 hypothetical protein [Corynebacterium sp. 35RC1]MCQ9353293.1 hypothetical protein [Corynebacterium sp. 209RC1]MCQ9355568.1 hypothetical protein [Corynebacterium sp. 1222RC1]MCQ9357752.1 hypothetical protein [Corynebacterium sp. 122RC1]
MDNDDLWHLVWAELSSKSITAMSSFSALPRRMEFEHEQQEQGMGLNLQRLDGEGPPNSHTFSKPQIWHSLKNSATRERSHSVVQSHVQGKSEKPLGTPVGSGRHGRVVSL